MKPRTGSVVSIVTWVLLACTLVVSSLKVILAQQSIGLNDDDFAIVVSVLLCIAQSIIVSFQVPNGVGQHRFDLTLDQLHRYEKMTYASQILYILTLTASKLSICLFTYHLTRIKRWRWISILVGTLIIVSNAAYVFVVGFQCRMPSPWAILDSNCVNLTAVWVSYAGLNILLEILLIGLPAEIVRRVNMNWDKRFAIIASFFARLAVIASLGVQIWLIKIADMESSDTTFTSWSVVLCQQVVQNLSIITVCIPYIKNLLLGLESGMLQTGHFRLRQSSIAQGYSSVHNIALKDKFADGNPEAIVGGADTAHGDDVRAEIT